MGSSIFIPEKEARHFLSDIDSRLGAVGDLLDEKFDKYIKEIEELTHRIDSEKIKNEEIFKLKLEVSEIKLEKVKLERDLNEIKIINQKYKDVLETNGLIMKVGF